MQVLIVTPPHLFLQEVVRKRGGGRNSGTIWYTLELIDHAVLDAHVN